MNKIQQRYREILHSEKKIDDCCRWLRNHQYTHPEFGNIVSQLRQAELSLLRLRQADSVPGAEQPPQELFPYEIPPDGDSVQ